MSKILYNDVDSQQAAWQGVRNAAKGQDAGVPAHMVSADDIDALKQAAESAAKEYEGSPTAGPASMLAYTAGAHRDASYALAGRKYLMVAGMNRMSVYTCNRAALITQVEIRKED